MPVVYPAEPVTPSAVLVAASLTVIDPAAKTVAYLEREFLLTIDSLGFSLVFHRFKLPIQPGLPYIQYLQNELRDHLPEL